MIRVGTAGWAIPRAHADAFPAVGSGLERYGAVFNAVEINSSFYRSHVPAVWMRWAAAVPDHFRFSVKFPKAATHEARLVGCEGIIERFLAETSTLGDKRGPVLIQLPPSLAFDTALAGQFFTALRDRFSGSVACEPRHATWFGREAEAVLTGHAIARVAADPPRVPAGDNPGGVQSMSYWRMHGSPRCTAPPMPIGSRRWPMRL